MSAEALAAAWVDGSSKAVLQDAPAAHVSSCRKRVEERSRREEQKESCGQCFHSYVFVFDIGRLHCLLLIALIRAIEFQDAKYESSRRVSLNFVIEFAIAIQ